MRFVECFRLLISVSSKDLSNLQIFYKNSEVGLLPNKNQLWAFFSFLKNLSKESQHSNTVLFIEKSLRSKNSRAIISVHNVQLSWTSSLKNCALFFSIQNFLSQAFGWRAINEVFWRACRGLKAVLNIVRKASLSTPRLLALHNSGRRWKEVVWVVDCRLKLLRRTCKPCGSSRTENLIWRLNSSSLRLNSRDQSTLNAFTRLVSLSAIDEKKSRIELFNSSYPRIQVLWPVMSTKCWQNDLQADFLIIPIIIEKSR